MKYIILVFLLGCMGIFRAIPDNIDRFPRLPVTPSVRQTQQDTDKAMPDQVAARDAADAPGKAITLSTEDSDVVRLARAAAAQREHVAENQIDVLLVVPTYTKDGRSDSPGWRTGWQVKMSLQDHILSYHVSLNGRVKPVQ